MHPYLRLLIAVAPLLFNPLTLRADDPSPTPHTVDLRPFELIAPSDHLLGDWDGARTKLENAGLTPTLTLVTNVAWNPTGGQSQGITEASNLGLDLLFDLQKIAHLNGASFLVQGSERFGSGLSADYIGNVFAVQQVFGGETFRVVDVAYQQKLLDDHLEFRLGRLAAGDDFLVSTYDYLFMQNGFDGNPVGIFFNAPGMTAYPNATWGAMAKIKPIDRFYLMAGVYNGDPTIRDNSQHGVNGSLDGPLFAMGEIGYQLNGLPHDHGPVGNYKAGFWFDNSTYSTFQSAQSTQGSWGFYGLFDQLVLPFDDRNPNRGVGLFGSALFATDPAIAKMPFFFTAGVAARGVWNSRPDDSCGLGVLYGQFSDDLQDSQRQAQQLNPALGVQTYEMAIELTYRFYFVHRALFFQPDLQYIIQPGGTTQNDNALVLGCQFGINF